MITVKLNIYIDMDDVLTSSISIINIIIFFQQNLILLKTKKIQTYLPCILLIKKANLTQILLTIL